MSLYVLFVATVPMLKCVSDLAIESLECCYYSFLTGVKFPQHGRISFDLICTCRISLSSSGDRKRGKEKTITAVRHQRIHFA